MRSHWGLRLRHCAVIPISHDRSFRTRVLCLLGKLSRVSLSRAPSTKPRYFGHSGTACSEKGMREASDRLRPFFTNEPPVENPPKIPETIQWVQPKLVCEVAFAEWTLDGELQ